MSFQNRDSWESMVYVTLLLCICTLVGIILIRYTLVHTLPEEGYVNIVIINTNYSVQLAQITIMKRVQAIIVGTKQARSYIYNLTRRASQGFIQGGEENWIPPPPPPPQELEKVIIISLHNYINS